MLALGSLLPLLPIFNSCRLPVEDIQAENIQPSFPPQAFRFFPCFFTHRKVQRFENRACSPERFPISLSRLYVLLIACSCGPHCIYYIWNFRLVLHWEASAVSAVMHNLICSFHCAITVICIICQGFKLQWENFQE